jgi:hypothetical protein
VSNGLVAIRNLFGVAIAGAVLGLVLSRLSPVRLPERPVEHIYGSAITVAFPGQKDQLYFRWCDPAGYMVWANGFAENSPLTVVRDSRCDVGR